MKILIAPDSYKGNQSALEVGKAIERGIHNADTGIETVIIPMADGGEGTVEAAASAAGGKLITLMTAGPFGSEEPVEASYSILEADNTAVIEMAAASGLPLIPAERKNPLNTTTLGTGELIRDALDRGCRKIIIGIGGSGTNDGGMGAAYALGVRFFDSDGSETGITGADMEKVASIDISGLDTRISETQILTACDVNNPFYGNTGAAYVYGPQKGATPQIVQELDRGLRSLAEVIKKDLEKDVSLIPGSGAAGGLGGGLVAFMGAELKSGIDLIMDAVKLEDAMQGADLVFTGEGKTDFQTAFGKVPAGVAGLAEKNGIPAVCFSGALGKKIEELYSTGITALFSTANREMTLEYAIENSLALIEQGAENITRLFAAGYRSGSRKE